MRDKKSSRAAVFGSKIIVVKSKRDPRLLVHEIFQRKICGVATVRMHESMGGVGFDVDKHRIQGNTFPMCSEFRPSRYAMNVDRNRFGRQLAKCLPIPSAQNICASLIVNSHWSSGTRGVGPADKTGKSVVGYCPGGNVTSEGVRRPEKPREVMAMGNSP